MTGMVAFAICAIAYHVVQSLCSTSSAPSKKDGLTAVEKTAVSSSSSAAAPSASASRAGEKGMLIGIEGNISSGKSTVCAHLQNGVCSATGQPMRVMFEQISPLLLKLFYGGASRYAFTLQLTTLQKRIDNIWRMRNECDTERSIGLLDRSTMGDLIFASKQLLDGNIDEHETAVYVEEWVRSVLNAGYFVDQVLYLHSTPELCRSRVAQRGNVDKDVKSDYLNDIDNLHVYGLWWLLTSYPNAKKVFVADWRRFGNANDLLASLFRRDACSMRWADDDSSAASASHTVSKLEAKDLDFYSENLEAVKQLRATVMIPYDSHIAPLPDVALPKLSSDFRYVHSQAFKNCVMSCLSEGKRVVFYLSRPHEPRPLTIFDFFSTLPSRIGAVQGLALAANNGNAVTPSAASVKAADEKEARSGPESPDRVHCPESPSALNTVKVPPRKNTESPTRRKVVVSIEDKNV